MNNKQKLYLIIISLIIFIIGILGSPFVELINIPSFFSGIMVGFPFITIAILSILIKNEKI